MRRFRLSVLPGPHVGPLTAGASLDCLGVRRRLDWARGLGDWVVRWRPALDNRMTAGNQFEGTL